MNPIISWCIFLLLLQAFLLKLRIPLPSWWTNLKKTLRGNLEVVYDSPLQKGKPFSSARKPQKSKSKLSKSSLVPSALGSVASSEKTICKGKIAHETQKSELELDGKLRLSETQAVRKPSNPQKSDSSKSKSKHSDSTETSNCDNKLQNSINIDRHNDKDNAQTNHPDQDDQDGHWESVHTANSKSKNKAMGKDMNSSFSSEKSKTHKQRQNAVKREKIKAVKNEQNKLQELRYENYLRTKALYTSPSDDLDGWIQVGPRRQNKVEN